MSTIRTFILTIGFALAVGALSAAGCEKRAETAPKTPAPAANSDDDGHDHDDADGHDHDHDHGDGHDHGPVTQLGEQSAGGFTIKASRDGAVTAGGDAPIDASITGSAKVAAVRFWIGSRDAKGSVKARAEAEQDHWHAHVEVPKPLPEGSRLWVEVETDKGEKSVAGFDLKL